jgi:hypothetical protein
MLRLLCLLLLLPLLRVLSALRAALVLPLGIALLIALLVALRVGRDHRADKRDAGETGGLNEIHDGSSTSVRQAYVPGAAG